MDQSQILQPCPHFIIMLPFMVKFRSKIYFLECKYQGWKKSILKSVSLISNCNFYEKKIFFLQNFCDFWVFLKFRSKVAKSETGTWFFRIFRTFWHLYWPWVCVRIEMGNLEAKTPCVNCGYKDNAVWNIKKSLKNRILWNCSEIPNSRSWIF